MNCMFCGLNWCKIWNFHNTARRWKFIYRRTFKFEIQVPKEYQIVQSYDPTTTWSNLMTFHCSLVVSWSCQSCPLQKECSTPYQDSELQIKVLQDTKLIWWQISNQTHKWKSRKLSMSQNFHLQDIAIVFIQITQNLQQIHLKAFTAIFFQIIMS